MKRNISIILLLGRFKAITQKLGDVCFYFRVTPAYMAPPTTPSTAGTAGLIEKLNSINIPTIPRAIIKAVRIEPAINFMKFDLM